ncbi:MAG: alcohol dehydrogenase catalytic domain-containing protein [Acidobacteriia bacterium]|nr:alcohol dehydrogenase catalytic domain-containing protein [Terriglobia bacterium]MBV8904720.1 alcohol dehydrogenase catalytic domain-containing protein [Terriglobia bacterium]
MKAVLMTAVKEPFAMREILDPQPGPGQVRIRMNATGVCGTDVHVWNGELPVPLPIVLGHEPVGVIDLAGQGVTSVRVGDRVGVSWFQSGCGRCPYCQKRQVKFCASPKTWITNGGGYAEYMIAEADGCALLPDGLASEIAAPLFCGGFSAMSAYRAARPRPGERVAVIGIGGLGHLALQVAKSMGHEVLAITNSADKERDARSLGADQVLVVRDHAGQELQDMGGADIVLSFSPSMRQNSQVLQGLLPGGRLVTTAVSAEPIQADPVQMLFKQTCIVGSAQNDPADLIDILKLAAQGKVKPTVETYRIDEVNSIIARLAEGKVRHRAVIVQDG